MKKSSLIILSLLLAMSAAFAGCAESEAPAATEADATPVSAPTAQPAAKYTYADTIKWDGQYDVVVIGYGGAGANASIAAADSGASVLLTEKAPKGEEGGNTRYSGQFTLISYDYDQTLTYLKGLAGGRDYNEEILKVFAKGLTEVKDYYEGVLGAQGMTASDVAPAYANAAREFKEYEGFESVDWYLMTLGGNDAAAWNLYRENINKRSEQIDVWYSSPAVHLIQDPISKTVIGVQINKEGELLNIRANNGVVMACGGFENNEYLKENYLGIDNLKPVGTIYNTGDGIAMALEVGANLWHMSNWATSGTMHNYCIDTQGEEAHGTYITNVAFAKGAGILVGRDGTRFCCETIMTRHGKTNVGGQWITELRPATAYFVCDSAKYAEMTAAGLIPERHMKYVQEYPSIEALAEALGATKLPETVDRFNSYAANGLDPEFERAADTMTAFLAEGPYYAIKMQPYMLNTQGGAQRDENAQVIAVDGTPIPNLYSAGEFGSITINDYNGGGNISECVVFGRIAGENAATPKAGLPVYTLASPVESDIRYTLNSESDSEVEYEAGENQYIGISSSGMGGDIVVRVTLLNNAISAVEILSHNETPGISDAAISGMGDVIVAAQSTEVDVFSGCTVSSNAIIKAVDDALAKSVK